MQTADITPDYFAHEVVLHIMDIIRRRKDYLRPRKKTASEK